MTKTEFYKKAKNWKNYRVIKPFKKGLFDPIVDASVSAQTLYEEEFSIDKLLEKGFIKEIPDVFPFEKEVVGKNIHSVYTHCLECGFKGINLPLIKECGNCGFPKTQTYYDAATIDSYLRSLNLK